MIKIKLYYQYLKIINTKFLNLIIQKMKSFIVLCLVAFLATSNSLPMAREFISALLAGAGKSVELDPECFGDTFDQNLVTLKEYADAENHLMIILTAQKIALDIYNNCPKDKVLEIIQIIKTKIDDKSIYDDIINKAMNVSKILVAEYKATTHTATSIGKALGECVAVFIKASSSELNLEVSNDVVNDLIEGILDGLTKEGEKGLCKADVIKDKEEIIKIVQDVIAALKEGKDIMEVLSQAVIKLLGMADLLTDCRLFNLVTVIKTIMTQEGIDALVKRVTENLSTLLVQVQNIITSVLGKDFAKAGTAIGTILKVVLDFYVN